MKTKKLKITSFILALLLLLSLAGCRKTNNGPKLESRNLMQTIKDKREQGKDITDTYKSAVADASIQLFKTVAADQNRQGKNTDNQYRNIFCNVFHVKLLIDILLF